MAVKFTFRVTSGKAKGLHFEVMNFSGTEEISRPYRFEIQLASTDRGIELGDLVGALASLTVGRDQSVVADGGSRHFHGILAEAAVIGASHDRQQFFYEVVLVPRLWLLSRSRGYRVYATDKAQTVSEVVKAVFKDDEAVHLTEKEDFELRNLEESDDDKRDYYAQYDETRLDFASRLMEHVGQFYFFEQGEQAEKLIIGNRNEAFRDVHGSDTRIHYRADTPGGAISPQAIQSYVGRRRQIPAKLLLTDYDYDLTVPTLSSERTIDAAGGPLSKGANNTGGVVAHFGDYGKPNALSPDDVKLPADSAAKAKERIARLCRIRAEEIACRQIVFEGRSDREDLYPGGHFKLQNHFRDEMNATYLVTSVRHGGTSPTYGKSGLPGAGAAEAGYRNQFEAIHSEVQFRPERRTPKPAFHGMMPATIDTKSGVAEDERAQIDVLGRYKVRLPFDAGVDGRKDGQHSSYMRMSTLSAGAKQGFHFPLLPEAEVIWSCVGGDIDRPVICGALPNRKAPSNVTSANRTQSRIDTPGGIQIVMNDGPGKSK